MRRSHQKRGGEVKRRIDLRSLFLLLPTEYIFSFYELTDDSDISCLDQGLRGLESQTRVSSLSNKDDRKGVEKKVRNPLC